MATTESRTNSSGGQKYVDFDEFIDYQVRKTRTGIRSTDLLTSVVVLALVLTSYLLAFVVMDHWVVAGGLGYWPRLLALTLVTLFIVGWTAWKLVIPYLRRVSALFAAREIEHAQPDLKSSLLTLIDLKRAGRAVPPHIVAAMEKRAARKLSATDIEQAVDRRLLMRLSYALLAVVAVMCAYTVFSPKSISNSVLRALMPASSRSVSTRTRIEAVDPGDAEVLARSQLEVTVDLAGEIPETATLLYSSADRSFVDEPIMLRDTGEGLHRFRGVLAGPNGRGLLQNLTYRIVAGDAESREYQVTVKQAPYATVTEVLLDYPDYMRLDDKTQPGGDIDAWEGTVVTLRAETNMPVASGTIERSTADDASLGTDSLPMTLIDDTHLEVTWRLEFDEGVPYRFYRIDVRTESGAGDPRPRFYSVNIRRDIPPEVRILHPTGDVELPANGVLPVAYEALDPDFLLRYVRMYFEQPGEAPEKFAHRTRRLFEAPPERSSARGIEDVRLSDFDLKAGDVLSLWLEARDNQAPLGAEDGNTTRTSRINITILDPISPEEARKQLEEQREQLQQELQESQQDGEAGGEQTAEATGEQEGESDAEGGEPSETTEGDSGEPGEESTGSGQTQGDEGTAAQRSDGTGGNEETPDAEAGREPGQESGEASEAEQPGAEPSADEEQTDEGTEASESAEAEDNEALRRLIDEYNALEEAQRRREQEQQEAAQESREGEPDQPGEQPQSDDADGQGGESPSGSESESQTPSAGPNQPSGDETGTGQSPGESESASEGGGEETPADDPTADARSGDVENGTETPTDEEGPAQRQRATGDEEGTARPETDPNAEPAPAREPIEREGGDPATRPTEQPSDEQGEGMPQDTGGGERPEGAQPAPDTDAEPSDSPGDRGSSQSGMPEADRPPARSDQQPSGPDQSDPAPGAREGQRSEQPASGEQGSGQQASEGTQGGSQQGPGDATSSPGSQSDAAGQSGGQPGDRAGEGSTSQAGGNQPGGEGMSDQLTQEGQGGGESGSQEGAGEGGGEGSQGGGEGGQGGGEGSQGEGEGGQGGGAEGGGQGGQEGGGGGGGEGSQSQGGQTGTTQGGGTESRSGGGGTGGSGGQAPNGSGGGADSGADSRPLDPNLEDKRRASELVLERLKDQLERGEAPEELLDDLGWTEEKLRDFMGRLEQRLADTGEDTSPEAEARRRQFETILEGIDYASEGQQRDAGDGPRQSAEGFGSQRRPVPPEFREQQEVYRRRLSRQTRGE